MQEETLQDIPQERIKAEPLDYIISEVKSEDIFVKTESFTCGICGIYVRDGGELAQHTLVHSTDSMVSADVSIKGLFKQHACHTCDKVFTCKAALKRHLMIHTGNMAESKHEKNRKRLNKNN